MDDTRITHFLRSSIRGLIAVYRFGSTASGQMSDESDIDIAFLADAPMDPVERFELQERLAGFVRRDVDLLDLREASTVMRMQVISTGRVLATFDRERQEAFEDLTYSAYARLNEERREILDQVRREGRVHGG